MKNTIEKPAHLQVKAEKHTTQTRPDLPVITSDEELEPIGEKKKFEGIEHEHGRVSMQVVKDFLKERIEDGGATQDHLKAFLNRIDPKHAEKTTNVEGNEVVNMSM